MRLEQIQTCLSCELLTNAFWLSYLKAGLVDCGSTVTEDGEWIFLPSTDL